MDYSRFYTKDELAQSFRRHGLLNTLGISMRYAEAGLCLLSIEYDKRWTQHHGYFHAGVISALADTASGYAAMSLVNATEDIVTAEFKINFLTPAIGDRLLAEARVIKDGRRIKVVRASVFTVNDDVRRHCAEFQGSMSVLKRGRASFSREKAGVWSEA